MLPNIVFSQPSNSRLVCVWDPNMVITQSAGPRPSAGTAITTKSLLLLLIALNMFSLIRRHCPKWSPIILTIPGLTHLPLDKMAAVLADDIFKCIFWTKMVIFRLKFYWNLFPEVQLTINQHWFRWWLGTEQATSHYLNQCWPSSLTHICGTKGRLVNNTSHTVSSCAQFNKRWGILPPNLVKYREPQDWVLNDRIVLKSLDTHQAHGIQACIQLTYNVISTLSLFPHVRGRTNCVVIMHVFMYVFSFVYASQCLNSPAYIWKCVAPFVSVVTVQIACLGFHGYDEDLNEIHSWDMYILHGFSTRKPKHFHIRWGYKSQTAAEV